MKRSIFILAVLFVTISAKAQNGPDSIAIKQAALDYIEGYYTADAARMEKALHPKLAKRIVFSSKDGKKCMLGEMDAQKLIDYTGKKPDESKEHGKLDVEVRIYGIYGKIATASITTSYFDFIDYIHLGKYEGKWKIVNVIWEMKEKT